MKTTTKAALAAVLLAGVATAALAQDRDHGDRGGQAPAAHAAPAPQAAPAPRPEGFQRAGGHDGGRDGGPRSEGWQRPQGGSGRAGGSPPPAPASAMAAAPAAPAVSQPSPGGQRFNGGGDRHWDRGGPGAPANSGAPPARAFDHNRGPSEVVPPPSGAERGWDGRRDGHNTGPAVDARNARDGRWNGRDGRDGHWDGRGDGRDGRDPRWADGRDHGHWPGGRPAEHWQAGRYPPVYWSHDRYRLGFYRPPYGFYVRSWGFGDILPRGWYGPDYYLDDFLDFGLPYPPPGYEWVRVGGDAIMIDEYTGRIVQVVRGIFY